MLSDTEGELGSSNHKIKQNSSFTPENSFYDKTVAVNLVLKTNLNQF